MPNPSNILSPINIHGFGRSGTTLLQNMLGQTGFIQVCNETPALLYNCFRGGELLLSSFDKEVAGLPGDGSAATRAVHAAYCGVMPSQKTAWCQKLGGIPNSVVWEEIVTDADRAYAATPYEFPYDWYWKATRQSFPHSKDLLILRGWRDVVASRVSFSGYQADDVARDLAVYWNAMAHPAARFDHLISFAEFSAGSEKAHANIFRALGLQYQQRYGAALNWYAAPGRKDLQESRAGGFSWQAEFAALDQAVRDDLEDIVGPAVERMRARFPDAEALGH